MVRVAIAGAAGRMGRALIEAFGLDSDGSKVTVAKVLSDDPSLGVDSGLLAMGVENRIFTVSDISEYVGDFDVLVDFTTPAATLEHIALCQKHSKAMVIGTTGLNDEQIEKIQDAGRSIPIVFSPNMSIGVTLCFSLLEAATKVLGSEYDIEIFEAHHRHKKDSPSGTAIKMGQVVAETLGRDFEEVAIYDRKGIGDERDRGAIGFATVRAGDIVGDHTVTFAGRGERIEITHKASSRMTFANGAVRAATWIVSKKTGIYSMRDILNSTSEG